MTDQTELERLKAAADAALAAARAADAAADAAWEAAGVAEGLDANQKRAGQLGPTEKVGKNEKNLRGRLVGNESVDPEIIRIRKLSGI